MSDRTDGEKLAICAICGRALELDGYEGTHPWCLTRVGLSLICHAMTDVSIDTDRFGKRYAICSMPPGHEGNHYGLVDVTHDGPNVLGW